MAEASTTVQITGKVLEPANLENLNINVEDWRALLGEYFSPIMRDYINSTATGNLNLDYGFMEYLTTRVMGAERIGEGNGPFDIIKNGEFAADVATLCLNINATNEKSLVQRLREGGESLDELFINQNINRIMEIFKNLYLQKYRNGMDENNIENAYYFIFISDVTSVYLSIFKINLEAISIVSNNGLTTRGQSLKVTNFIDERYGKVIIYRAKKRMELRLKKEILEEGNTIELFNINDSV